VDNVDVFVQYYKSQSEHYRGSFCNNRLAGNIDQNIISDLVQLSSILVCMSASAMSLVCVRSKSERLVNEH